MSAIETLGEVETPVGILRCTLRAWESINASFGSYGEAYRRVSQMDAAAICTIVAEGQGKQVKDVKQAVFKNGLESLLKPIGQYLSMLSNGGRMPDESDEGKPAAGEG